MSLFGSLQLANNTLRAMQIGLQVVGQNISNVNTPGYIREQAVFSPGPVQKFGDLIIGLGVDVEGIVQKVDEFLVDRLRNARGERAGAEVIEQSYAQLERILNELSEADVSTLMTEFFGTVHDVLNQPDNAAIRSLATLKGQQLTDHINRLAGQVVNVHNETNERVSDIAGEINTLTEEIRTLNLRIGSVEAGELSDSDAGALRVQRLNALEKLATLVDIEVREQLSGGVNVTVGGQLLIFEGLRSEVEVEHESQDGLRRTTVQFADTNGELQLASGELRSIYEARDNVLAGFLGALDDFAHTFAFEFNKLHSQGQGLTGFDQLTSENVVGDATAALDAAGLPFTPVHGSLDVLVRNDTTGLQTTHTLLIDLDGLDSDLTLNDFAAQLSALPGLTATITAAGALDIQADSPDTQFAFAGDTSGLLAALGINSFFGGSTAGELKVSDLVALDPTKIATSRGGVGVDNLNAERLAGFLDQPLDSAQGATISEVYDQIVTELAHQSAVSSSVLEGLRTFEGTLESSVQANSGVSLDEEAIRMIALQRAYQATARYIQTISELLDVLMNI